MAVSPPDRASAVPTASTLTFNVVWTGTVFAYLQHFVASQMAHTEARFRFVANGCAPDQVELMEAFRSRHADQVVEVLDVSPRKMVPHGVALDAVRAQRDDGAHFCLIDPDIKANAAFVEPLAAHLGHHGAVTSGKEVWSLTNVIPEDQLGVSGEYFYARDGFTFGSPHLAIYEATALAATTDRWQIGFASNGQDLQPATSARLEELGYRYIAYDTGKIVNILLQADGTSLVHRDLPQLIHIGGLAHYLSPPGYVTDADGVRQPNWTRFASMADRHAVTRYTAQTLQALTDGLAPPPVPEAVDPSMAERLELVRAEVADLMARYRTA